MALVNFRRNWFGPNGVRYRRRDGLVQVPDDYIPLLPRDAEVFDDHGKALPSKSKEPLPGFGAKPLHEQNLDLIPGAAPVHMERVASSGPSPAQPVLSEEEEEKRAKEAEKASEELAGADPEAAEKQHKEESAAIQAGIDKVQELEKKQAEANDPVEAASKPGSAPKPAVPPTKK